MLAWAANGDISSVLAVFGVVVLTLVAVLSLGANQQMWESLREARKGIKCPDCGEQNKPRFCEHCGAPLSGDGG